MEIYEKSIIVYENQWNIDYFISNTMILYKSPHSYPRMLGLLVYTINPTFVDKSEGCLYTNAVKIDIIT